MLREAVHARQANVNPLNIVGFIFYKNNNELRFFTKRKIVGAIFCVIFNYLLRVGLQWLKENKWIL